MLKILTKVLKASNMAAYIIKTLFNLSFGNLRKVPEMMIGFIVFVIILIHVRKKDCVESSSRPRIAKRSLGKSH